MKNYVQYICTPSADAAGNLLFLHFDSRRYLIGNLPEGSQRISSQRAIGLRKVSDILLTGKTEWKNLGGLIGSMLSLADVKTSAIEAGIATKAAKVKNLKERIAAAKQTSQKGLQGMLEQLQRTEAEEPAAAERLRFYGAPNLNYAVACARRFVFRTGAPLEATEFGHIDSRCSSSPEPWSDEYVQIWPLPIRPSSEAPRSANGVESHGRKRSFDQFREVVAKDEGLQRSASETAKDVVHDMFNSDWTPDRLVEQPLRDVQMPAAPFVRNAQGHLEQYHGPLPGSSEPLPDINVLVRLPWPGALAGNLPSTVPSLVAMSYIIKNHPQRGRFIREKADKLNIQPKSLYRQLTQGETVTNSNGETITPDMVMEPGREGNGCVVADIPSVEYLQGFISRPEWQDENVMKGIGAFLWSLGPGVVNHDSFLSFHQRFRSSRHVLSCPERCSDGAQLDDAVKGSIRQHQLAPEHFSLLQKARPEDVHSSIEPIEVRDGFTLARPGLCLALEPAIAVEQEEGGVVPVDEKAALEIYEDEQLKSEIARIANESIGEQEFTRWKENIPFQDVEVFTLGTGSSSPSKHRNVSSTLVRVPGQGSYLLDAGEGTLGTLQRMFSPDVLESIFHDLRLIWISHLHADHHLGLVSVIKAWYQTVHGGIPAPELPTKHNYQEHGPRLGIVSDKHMHDFLFDYAHVEDFGLSRTLPVAVFGSDANSPVDLRLPTGSWRYQTVQSHPEILGLFNLSSLDSVYVRHCKGARAITMTTQSGFKFSYSGDCRPSLPFAAIGQDSHLLIHEATFEDNLRGEALAKRHSTAGEALVIASKMRAKSVILTHFSQRYPKMSDLGAVNIPSTAQPRASNTDDKGSTAAYEASLAKEEAEDAGDSAEHVENPRGRPKAAKASTPAPSSLDAPTPSADPKKFLDNTQLTITAEDVSRVIEEHNLHVVMAFDHMSVKMSNFLELKRKQPLLRLLYDKLAEREDAKDDGDGETAENEQPSGLPRKDTNRSLKADKAERAAKHEATRKARKGANGVSGGGADPAMRVKSGGGGGVQANTPEQLAAVRAAKARRKEADRQRERSRSAERAARRERSAERVVVDDDDRVGGAGGSK